MPSYTFRDKKTEETWTDLMTISEMEEYLNKNKTDSGWKDQLSRIAERHPESPLADRYGNKSHKALKTKSVLEKHRKRNKTK